MAPAREVRGLSCDGTLAEAACAILTVRLDELENLRGAISGPEDSRGLHDLRIAAKRVRYSLEMFSVCFGQDEAQSYADRVREMQDVLGRIHDLDVLQGLLAGRIALMDEETRERALQVATGRPAEGRRDEDLQDIARGDDTADGRLGLYRVIAAKADERRQSYDRFVALWQGWEESGLILSIRAMVAGVAAPAP